MFYVFFFFFFNDTATTEIYTLSLHDALPICFSAVRGVCSEGLRITVLPAARAGASLDRKSTRLNSSHLVISYAVFCLKKKKKKQTNLTMTIISDLENSYDMRALTWSFLLYAA